MEQNVWEQLFGSIVKMGMWICILLILSIILLVINETKTDNRTKFVFKYLKSIKIISNNREEKEKLEIELFEYIQNNFDTTSSEERKALFEDLKKKLSFWYCNELIEDEEIIDYLNKLI